MRLLLATLLLAGVAAPAGAQNVGITSAVNQEARGTPPSRAVRTLALGDNVIFNERIDTNPVGLLQILLADGTAFTAGPNSSLTIDRFVYDPNRGTAEVSATLTKGVFRFIGGRTSKTPGGVRLDSPVGTIGIRGAVVDMAIEGRGNGTVSMVFGREVTLAGPAGQANRVYEPGYSIVVATGPDGKESRRVVKTPPAAAGQIQTALAGRPGTTGGSANSPTDRIVADSDVPRDNSQLALVVNPPVPQPRPEPRGEVLTAVQEQNVDVVREDVAERTDGATPGTNPGTDPGTDPRTDPGTDPVSTAVPVRLLTAGATYTTNTGEVIQNPGAVGLVGGSAAEDQDVVLAVPQGGSTGTGSTTRGALVLPVYVNDDPDDLTFDDPQIITSGASLGGVPLFGVAYVGGRDFAAYELFEDQELTKPVHALYGTPVAGTSMFRNGDLRTYEYTVDLQQALPVPFFSRDALSTDFSSVSLTPIYVVETSGALASNSPSLFQSWLLIDGQGATQRSGIGVNVSNVFPEGGADGPLVAAFGRRGGYRASGLDPSFQSGGTIRTQGVPGGGNQFFGADGQYAVLTGDPQANDFLSDSSATELASGTRFSTFHAIHLVDETPLAQASTLQYGVSRPATISGFAAGTVESLPRDGVANSFSFASSASPDDFFITFDNAGNRLGGELDVQYQSSATSLHIAFGGGVNGNTNGGQSSYVDDDIFGARENGSRGRNRLTSIDPATNQTVVYTRTRDTNARTYLVSGDANPQPNFLPNGQVCECDFLEWGWWGTQIRATSDPNNAPNRQDVRAGVHLGTWVAGDIATNAAVSSLTGTASYEGSAVGSVVNKASGATQNYLASGAMNMSYNFGTQNGSMSISNFDGRNFSGGVAANTGDVPQALFDGTLSQTGGGNAGGAVKGAFVNNGPTVAAGVIGNFDLRTATTAADGTPAWSASGIVAGARR